MAKKRKSSLAQWRAASRLFTSVVFNYVSYLVISVAAIFIGGIPLVALVCAIILAALLIGAFAKSDSLKALGRKLETLLFYMMMLSILGLLLMLYGPFENSFFFLVGFVFVVSTMYTVRKSQGKLLLFTAFVWACAALIHYKYLYKWKPFLEEYPVFLFVAFYAVISVCLRIYFGSLKFANVFRSRRNLIAGNMLVVMWMQYFVFSNTWTDEYLDDMLATPGVTSLLNYRDDQQLREVSLLLNNVSWACEKDHYFLGFFDESGPMAIYDGINNNLVTFDELDGDASRNIISMCEKEQYLFGIGNTFYLISEHGGEVRIHDTKALSDEEMYVERFDVNPATGDIYASAWSAAKVGLTYQVNIEDDKIRLRDKKPWAVASHNGNEILAFDGVNAVRLVDGTETARVPFTYFPNMATFSFAPDLKKFYITSFQNGRVEVYDAESLMQTNEIELRRGARFAAYNPKFNVLLVGNYTQGEISVIDATTDKIVNTINFGYRTRTIQFSPDYETAGYFSAAGIFLLDVAVISGKAPPESEIEEEPVYPPMTLSPDGVLAGIMRGPGNRELLVTPSGEWDPYTVNSDVCDYDWSPDSRYLVYLGCSGRLFAYAVSDSSVSALADVADDFALTRTEDGTLVSYFTRGLDTEIKPTISSVTLPAQP